MKKIYMIAFACSVAMAAFAQCPSGVAIRNITQPACGSNNGKFTVTVTATITSQFESSIDGGNTWVTHSGNDINYSNMPAANYNVQVRRVGTTELCTNRNFLLRADYKPDFTATAVSATGCSKADGSILLGGNNASAIAVTDSVSWISSINPSFVAVSSLATPLTIPGLKPGIYYVIIKNPANNYCYTTKKVTVGNNGTACAAIAFCGDAQGPNNFPNPTFGAGADKNGPALPAGETAYGYSQLAARGPDDGFYAITNSTDYNGSGGKVFDKWIIITDHTGNTNGYMMVVNASYDPDVVIEKTITGLCVGKKYQFSAWIRNIHPDADAIKPNLTFLIDGVGQYTTGDVTNNTDWFQIGFTFQTTSTSARFSIRNNNGGGTGNDWAIDDIYVGSCVPKVELKPIIATCDAPPAQATATITDGSLLYDTYQWQIDSLDGKGWKNTGPVNTASFDASGKYTATVTLPSPLTIANNGWRYRIIVGTSSLDIDPSSIGCSYSGTQALILQECGAILPVKLTSVKAALKNNYGEVVWQVAEQLNIHHYELEKSTDGIHFIKITAINAGSSATATYKAMDNTISNGLNYYRIKIVDENNKYSYSSITSLFLKDAGANIKIFPNPAADHLYILRSVSAKLNSLVITDATGRVLMKKSIIANGTNVSDVAINSLPSGMYFITLFDTNNHSTHCSFIKK